MGANHLDNIIINIILDPAPLSRVGFSTAMIIADGSTTSLDGDRIRTYASIEAVQTDVTAGFVSAAMLAAATTAFSQTTPPQQIKIGRKAVAEAYDVALAAIRVVDDDFYGVAIESRAAADQVLVGTAVEALSKFFAFQSSDVAWGTTGFPPNYTTLQGNERSAVSVHDTDTVWSDFGWLANRLVFDPDEKSVPWDAGVQGVTGFATAPTDTQKTFYDANDANVGLPYGSVLFFIDPGVNLNGRSIHEIQTADWFEVRLQEAVVAFKTAASARGDKVIIGPTGQGSILSLIAAQFQIGVNAKHFVAGQTEQTAETITQADIDARRLRFSGRGQIASSATVFQFTFNFQRTPLFEEEIAA